IRIAGSPDSPGGTGDGGLATSALLDQPADAYPDPNGGVIIADRNNNRVRRVDALGMINTIAGSGTAGYAGDGVAGGALAAQFNNPSCILPIPTADGGGFFVCDEQNNVIRRVSSTSGAGTVTTVAGTGVAGFADGPATTAQLDTPVNLAFDANKNLL